jgi:hypothetical protein
VTRFLLDTSTVSAAMWKTPHRAFSPPFGNMEANAQSARRSGTSFNSEFGGCPKDAVALHWKRFSKKW